MTPALAWLTALAVLLALIIAAVEWRRPSPIERLNRDMRKRRRR